MEAADVTKLIRVVFSTRFRCLENMYDHPCHITGIDDDFVLSLLISGDRPENDAVRGSNHLVGTPLVEKSKSRTHTKRDQPQRLQGWNKPMIITTGFND